MSKDKEKDNQKKILKENSLEGLDKLKPSEDNDKDNDNAKQK